MSILSLKYVLKRGIKKFASDPIRNICAVLLCAACALLFTYAEMFFLYDPATVMAKFIKRDLNESELAAFFRHVDDNGAFSALGWYNVAA